MESINNLHYDSSDIQVLEGLEAVRKRPGMYIGTTGSKGLHHLVWEIVDNAVDEALAGYCDDIEITIEKNNIITVKDDGRGIPIDIHPKTGVSTVETVYTVLHAGGKFGNGGYKVSGGLHGVGASVVNALSSFLEVTVYKEGKIYFQRFKNGGKPEDILKIIGECDINRTGTTVSFKADPTIFEETIEYDYDILKNRTRELAFLNKGLRFILTDEREDTKKDIFIYEGGISEYVNLLNKNKTPIHKDIIYFEETEEDIKIDISLQYTDTYTENIYSFVNNINTYEGGTHDEGVKRALTRIINNYAKTNGYLKQNDEALIGEDVREGLTMIISVKHPNPQFEGQTKTKLGNTEIRKISDNIFSNGLERYLLENPEEARKIMDKVFSAARARMAAKKARELTRRKGLLDISNQWEKLTDCSSKDPTISEIFIVEGRSAEGPAKQGRDSKTQAVIPIRGKILNVEKSRLDRILGNEEIRNLITAFGTGIGEEFDYTKLRYYKIIIMTDADVDGSHIRTLLLTFLYRYFKPLVEKGHVYAAQPPLFRISHGKTQKYVLNEKERDEYISTLPENTKVEIVRMKGLGEMDAIELRETTMSVNSRTLIRLNVEDAIVADETFQLLMGEEVEPRRQFIEENALKVRNLDV
ncbi:MAG: DNA topoisomerase (ATP-hydrolyzing) subunit B [Bacilli bacterium]|jgi:DNA gyrase subunit B|nr:DNA topoisomerase (ATP-hydrolyzing) subunit B [Bacilli bacterium]MDD3995581.1 DNA topoisomerase (ATP-hydrolyzing) subunit B [Bacilli bacterium]MDD4624520.1 DNA topoisomerase (ATP-hydrolyzing) subunit B [Bacilli bacterium]